MSNKSKFKQTYRRDWELLPEFKGWLRSVPDDSKKAYCIVCNKTLYAHRLSLLQHSCTVRHSKLAHKKFLTEEKQKTCPDLSDTISIVQLSGDLPESSEEQMVTMNSDVLNGVVDTVLNGLNEVDMNPTDYVEPNLYILPDHCFDNSCVQVNGSPPVSTHVLDTSRGTPAQNMGVCLYQLKEGRWVLISDSVTNADGRCDSFITRDLITAGRYKLLFDVNKYFQLRKQESFYPYIEVAFDVRSPSEHYHIPLILSPFGYSTYKGS